MIILTKDQQDCMLQGNHSDFIMRVQRFIADTMPDEVRGIPEHLVFHMIETAVLRARSHGLRTDAEIIAFVGVMFEIAPNFDEEPTLAAILADASLTPGRRWDALFAGTPALCVAWERAAHPNFYDHRGWISPFAQFYPLFVK